MEGREYSSTADVDRHTEPGSDEEEEFDLLETHDETATYVIQVPKDQIYRIPPPENAIFAEARRTAIPQGKSIFTINCILLSALVLTLFVTLITGICLTVADKEDPTFRVQRIHTTTKGKGKNKQYEFDFTLRSENKNNHAILTFEQGGKALLAFRDTRLANGKFPSFGQDTKSLENTKLKLVSGSGKTLPKVIQKSMNGTSRAPVKLSLGFSVPLRFKVAVFPVKSKRLSIVCNVKVKRLTKQARILSQDCDYSTS